MTRLSTRRIAMLALLPTFLAATDIAEARTTRESAGEQEVARCIRQASRGRAWLERTLWGLRDQEGGWIGAAVANTNGTLDLGPLQVNSWWVPKIAVLVKRPETHVRHWLQYDACFNAEAARWIFLSGLRDSGDYWKAIGAYHSPTPWRQVRYTGSVIVHLERRYRQGLWADGRNKSTDRRRAAGDRAGGCLPMSQSERSD